MADDARWRLRDDQRAAQHVARRVGLAVDARSARASFRDMRGPRLYVIQTPVQADKTGDSLREILRELNDINGPRPITQAEMDRVIVSKVRRLPAMLQSQSSLLGALTASADYGRSLDYVTSLPSRYESLILDDLRAAARELLRPNDMIWVIVGDRTLIEPQIATLQDALPIEHYARDGSRTN